MRGRQSQLVIILTSEERQEVERRAQNWRQPAYLHARARMVLLRADGMTVTDIGRTIGISRENVDKALRYWDVARLDSLKPRKWGGRPKRQDAPRTQTVGVCGGEP